MRSGGARKGGQVTLADVAAAAGVGKATVDRVINARGGVSDATALAVITAARELGLRRILPKPHRPLLRIELHYPQLAPPNSLNRSLERAFAEIGRVIDRDVVINRTHYELPMEEAFYERLRASRADAIVIVAYEDPTLARIIEELVDRGVTVVTTVSDLPQTKRDVYIGIDQTSAGRTAAFLSAPGLPRQGRALVLSFEERAESHRRRVQGFTECMARLAPRIVVEPPIFSGNQLDLLRTRLSDALSRFSDVAMIYNAGMGNRIVADQLSVRGLRGKVTFVSHELTSTTHDLLLNNRMFFTIDQNTRGIAAQVVEYVLKKHGFLAGSLPQQSAIYVPFSIYSVENVEHGSQSPSEPEQGIGNGIRSGRTE